jgi:hypothetical protein
VLYVGLVLAQYLQATGNLDLFWVITAGRGDVPDAHVAQYTVGLNVFGFFAVALLSGSLAERRCAADVRLEQASAAMADLQAFNQYVIDNLPSGLATPTAEPLLTFNRSAMASPACRRATRPSAGRRRRCCSCRRNVAADRRRLATGAQQRARTTSTAGRTAA